MLQDVSTAAEQLKLKNQNDMVREFLTTDWEGGIAHGLEKGFLI